MLGVTRHKFHLVDPSPWPIITAFSVFSMLLGAVLYMHKFIMGGFLMFFGLISVALTATLWWRDVVREATFERRHTQEVIRGIKLGMILFITSEVMFFFGFFWTFFHSALAPTAQIGAVWPPVGINPLNVWDVPLLNTVILLLSGVTITWAHHNMLLSRRPFVIVGYICTLALAIIFTALQVTEYRFATFSIYDSVYGSIFYMATGFHGFHVIVGTIFISVCFFRELHHHLISTQHVGFEAAAWYWHFVDVVWLFLFATIYWWGSL